MTEVFIASSNSYYYIFHEPVPELGVVHTVTNVSSPNTTDYAELSQTGIACFTAGTMILTPRGERPVEALRKGDLVATLDNGVLPIIWIGERRVDHRQMTRHKGLRPFLVRKNAFGPGLPHSETRFSRQHRILLNDRIMPQAMTRQSEALAPIHTMTSLRGVRELCPPTPVRFIHFLLEDHNLVWSNGLPTETLLLTPYSATMTHSFPQAIVNCPLDLARRPMPPARPILHNKIARSIARKQARSSACANTKPVPQYSVSS